jgi:hypothetical protein
MFLDVKNAVLVSLPTSLLAPHASIAQRASSLTVNRAVTVARAALQEKRGAPVLGASKESTVAKQTSPMHALIALLDTIKRKILPAFACPVCLEKLSPPGETRDV